MESLHTHAHCTENETANAQELLATKAHKCGVTPQILGLYLHEREEKAADTEKPKGHLLGEQAYCCPNEHENSTQTEQEILYVIELTHRHS